MLEGRNEGAFSAFFRKEKYTSRLTPSRENAKQLKRRSVFGIGICLIYFFLTVDFEIMVQWRQAVVIEGGELTPVFYGLRIYISNSLL